MGRAYNIHCTNIHCTTILDLMWLLVGFWESLTHACNCVTSGAAVAN